MSRIRLDTWTPEEDAKLIMLLMQTPSLKVSEIAHQLPGRTVRACKDHFYKYFTKSTRWSENKKATFHTLYER